MNHDDYYEKAVATAELDLESAVQWYREALENVENIQGRIKEQEQRHDLIRADLAAGKLSDREAGGLLFAINEDLQDLTALLIEANTACRAADPIRQREELARAQADLERSRKEAEFQALHDHVREIENTLLNALGELSQLGLELGRETYLSAVWTPSTALDRAIRLNVPPRVQ